ncbi:DUF3891 family protein [Marivirga sp.]|uniref:DUF3891 family protein n=1 Tax=Marivirga sp. TaxID=2018662 RepID=UPI002D7E14CE|nr:DUF3891 family protein [Marivirga sp.]HET8859114.1 DUF3891 family protein [Marivirga sp.]
MIVNTTNKGWEIISQYAHGLLAGQIAAQIHPKYRPKQWVETLTAIIEHDDKQMDLDMQSCLSDTGLPMDFALSKSESQNSIIKRARGLMDLALHKSSWIGLLISSHLNFLYNNDAAGKELKGFLKEGDTFRKQTVKKFGINEEQLNEYYQLLRFSDRLSLMICKDEVPINGRKLEINKSIDNQTYFASKDEKGNLIIEPWCFKAQSFDFSVETRYVKQAVFGSGKALKKAIDKSEVTLKDFKFKIVVT